MLCLSVCIMWTEGLIAQCCTCRWLVDGLCPLSMICLSQKSGKGAFIALTHCWCIHCYIDLKHSMHACMHAQPDSQMWARQHEQDALQIIATAIHHLDWHLGQSTHAQTACYTDTCKCVQLGAAQNFKLHRANFCSAIALHHIL